MTWLDQGGGPRAAAGWHRRLRALLGTERWEALRAFTHRALFPRPDGAETVVHGWFTLGNIVVADAPDTRPGTVVLSGPEAAWSRPETDLACVLGELLELTMVAQRQASRRPQFGRLRDALLSGYGPGWDRDAVATGAVVRIATHAHDLAAYADRHCDLHAYAPMLADLIDDRGRTALPPS